MDIATESIDSNHPSKLQKLKTNLLTSWPLIFIGFVFCITRIPYLTYPLGLLWRQVVKEGYRSYEAILSIREFKIDLYIEQPIYVFLLEIFYNITGKTPDGLVLGGRVAGFIFSAITLVLIYKISEMTFGNIAAKFAAFLYSLSPYEIFHGVGIQRETLMWLFGIVAIFYLIKYLNTQEEKYIIVNLAFSFLAILTKITAFYFLFTSIISLIFLYSGSSLKIRITLLKRVIAFFLFSAGLALFSLLFIVFSVDLSSISAVKHTIIYQPEVLFDQRFYSNFVINSIQFISGTTAFLGGIGFFFALLSFKKENIALVIWTFIAGVEFIFYGYGTIIHGYYVLYFLHPLVILAGNTLFQFYQIYVRQVSNNGHISKNIVSPLIIIVIFLTSGFFPLFYYICEVDTIETNRPLFEDIRSFGLFLNDYDLEGEEIAFIFWYEKYDWWKFHLTLARTYIAKPKIKVIYTYNVTEGILSANSSAIIGWSDDLSQATEVLRLNFNAHKVYPQNNGLPSIEVWYKS